MRKGLQLRPRAGRRQNESERPRRQDLDGIGSPEPPRGSRFEIPPPFAAEQVAAAWRCARHHALSGTQLSHARLSHARWRVLQADGVFTGGKLGPGRGKDRASS
jgi:hypothetical protein